MNDRDSLLAAIFEHPDEDTPRLMFADWLQENGAPDRGQFVRLQVEGAHAEPLSPKARKYEGAAQKLLDRHAGAWTEHLADRAIGWRFARGFIEHVGVNAATFARDAAALFAAEPVRSLLIERFASTTAPVPLDGVFSAPQMARVQRLDFSKLRNSADYFEPLSSCPRLGALAELNLRDSPVPVPWLRALLTGTALPALAALDLADNVHLPRVLAEALPQADHRQFLRLDLSYIPFRSDELRTVLSSRCVRGLDELRLVWRKNPAGDGPVTHLNLGWSIPWERLRVLDLDWQGVGDEGVKEIVTELNRRPATAPLRWLGLANNGLRADAVRALVGSNAARLKLYHLDLRGNGLTSGHRAALEERFPDARVLV
ncbi:MAG TPA: TIGR02996 domain-containing protein [Gemmata sp.]